MENSVCDLTQHFLLCGLKLNLCEYTFHLLQNFKRIDENTFLNYDSVDMQVKLLLDIKHLALKPQQSIKNKTCSRENHLGEEMKYQTETINI